MHRLHLLGRADLLAADGREVRAVVTQPRRFAVLAYLAMTASTGATRRDKLLGLFWPELTQDRARKALNKTAHFLRQALGDSVIVSRGAEEIAVDATQLWCDATAFVDAVQGSRMAEALELYSGELLPSFYIEDVAEFESWLADERARLRRFAARAAQSLAHLREGEGQFTTAIALARRAAELADEDERVVRQLLELLDRLGDRAAALYAYDRFARRLAADFEAEPSAETRALIARVRERSEPQHSPGPVAAAAPPSLASPAYTPHSEQSLMAALHTRGYAIERELGRGGMATVYLARDLKHDRQVAVKVLSPELGALRLADRFAAEIRVAARLQHPNIVPLFDSGSVDDVLFYVMPFVRGETLRDRLKRDGHLAIDEALRIIRAVAEALDHAHAAGVVHRDIKPENILLDSGRPLLADFGIALALSRGGVERITSTGLSLGTPQYMSPEQAAGEINVGPASDIYSVAAVTYEMLTGEPPFTGPNSRAVLARVMLEEPRSIRMIRSSVPQSVEAAVLKALAKHAADRFATAGDFARRLSEGPQPSSRPLWKQIGRRPIAALSTGLLATAAAVLFWPGGGESAEPAPASRWQQVRSSLSLPFLAGTVYVPERVLTVPFEMQTDDVALAQLGTQLLTSIPDAIAREGVGDPVPATTIRDLVSRVTGSPGRVADRLARETGAGLQLRGSCSRVSATAAACQVDVLRMPGKLLRMSVSVTGDPSHPSFAAELVERLLVALFVQQRWGDAATWLGEYLPRSLAAVRAYKDGWDRGFERRSLATAAQLDTGWVEAAALSTWMSGAADAESTLARLGRRPGLTQGERDVLAFVNAARRFDAEQLFELARRRFAVNPRLWVGELTYWANATGRARTAVEASKDAHLSRDEAPKHGAYHNRGFALHHLGRYQEHLQVAREYGRQRPGSLGAAASRGQEAMALAGLGMMDSLRARLAEWQASPEPPGTGVTGPAGTRSYIAGLEMMAHGNENEGLEVLSSALPLYYRLREQGQYIIALPEILLWTGRLAEARNFLLADLPKVKDPYDSLYRLSLLGAVAVREGKNEEALSYARELARYRQLLASTSRNATLAGRARYRQAVLAGWMGDREAAVRFLEEARALGGAVHWNVHREPAFYGMRDYPPFRQFLKPRD